MMSTFVSRKFEKGCIEIGRSRDYRDGSDY